MQSFEDCERAKGKRIVIPRARSRGVAAGWVVTALALALSAFATGGTHAAAHVETVVFDPGDLQFSRTEGYDLVSLGGNRWLTRPGEPRLPVEPYRIALPKGARVASVTISVAESLEVSGRFGIMPSRPPRPLSRPGRGQYERRASLLSCRLQGLGRSEGVAW